MLTLRDQVQRFDPFAAPLLTVLEQLGPAIAGGMRNEEVMRSLVGACRDWRGVLVAAHNKATYMQVFDALYPRHLHTLTRATEVGGACFRMLCARSCRSSPC